MRRFVIRDIKKHEKKIYAYFYREYGPVANTGFLLGFARNSSKHFKPP